MRSHCKYQLAAAGKSPVCLEVSSQSVRTQKVLRYCSSGIATVICTEVVDPQLMLNHSQHITMSSECVMHSVCCCLPRRAVLWVEVGFAVN